MKVLFAQLAAKAPRTTQQQQPLGPLFLKKSESKRESRRSKNQHSRDFFKSYSLSVKRTNQRTNSTDTTKSQKFEELSIATVTSIRNEERLALLRKSIEFYRQFLDPFEFHSKLNFMMLRNGNKHKIRSLKNFQYSLGKPKKVIFKKTQISIYGIRGDLINVKTPLGSRYNYIFKSFDNRFKMILPKLPKHVYICQSQNTKNSHSKRTSEMALLVSTDVDRITTKVVSFATKKVLISNNSYFGKGYCSAQKRAMYQNQNFNEPMLNEFSEKGITITNFHRCLKHGKERIINQFDLVKRKLTISKEVSLSYNCKEILGNFTNLGFDGKYVFFQKNPENILKIFLYDFVKDERKKIGCLETGCDVMSARTTKVETQVFKVERMPIVLKKKLKKFLEFYKEDIKTDDCECCSKEDIKKFDFDHDVFAVMDVCINFQYKIRENFLVFIHKKSYKTSSLKIDPNILLDYKFQNMIKEGF